MDEQQLRSEAAKIAAEWHAGGLAGGTIYEDFAVELAKRAVNAERERWAHVFDGWRVLQAMTPEQRKRIDYPAVSDVLDAVARLSRA